MKRFLLPLVGFALLVVVLVVGLRHAPEKGIIVSPLLGKAAPGFTLPDLMDGKQSVSSQSLQHQWYVFNVWGTWCAACREEHSALLAIKALHQVPIIGMDWKDEDSAALAWLSELGNPYDRVATDRDGLAAIDWGVYGAPETFLVNDAGIVLHKHVGAMSLDVWQQEFVPLLPKTAATPTGAGS
ncbi:MAG TPA: DsbE family thiol:disulfide interchange protein [Steroidobacteraceae bacterium]|nr:DsbE family thiol:disulfide interchange protein [Steroidobacteraceae bacterium]